MAPTITGDHNGHLNDYMAVVLMTVEARHELARCYDGNAAPPIIARAGTGGVIHLSCYYPALVLGSTCYNAPMTDGRISPTLCARAGTGGNQLPLILLKRVDE